MLDKRLPVMCEVQVECPFCVGGVHLRCVKGCGLIADGQTYDISLLTI